jgi:hypothetical protein
MNCEGFTADMSRGYAPFRPTRTIVNYQENGLTQFDIVQGESTLRLYRTYVQVPGDLDQRYEQLQL